MFLNVSLGLGTISISLLVKEIMYLFSLPISLQCCEDLSLTDKVPQTSCCEKRRTGHWHLPCLRQEAGDQLHSQEAWARPRGQRALSDTWMLSGGGCVGAEIKAPAALGRQQRCWDWPSWWEQNKPRVLMVAFCETGFPAPLRSQQKRPLLRVVLAHTFKTLLLKERMALWKLDAWQLLCLCKRLGGRGGRRPEGHV